MGKIGAIAIMAASVFIVDIAIEGLVSVGKTAVNKIKKHNQEKREVHESEFRKSTKETFAILRARKEAN